MPKTLTDYGPRIQELLVRAFSEGVELDDPLATEKRTNKLVLAGLIHKRTSKKGRTSWRCTDRGRGLVMQHIPVFLHRRGVPSYTTRPWQAMIREPEVIDAAA